MHMSPALRRAQQQYSTQTATLYKDKTMTFNELAQHVKHMADVLHQLQTQLTAPSPFKTSKTNNQFLSAAGKI